MALSRRFQTKILGDNLDKVGACCAVRMTITRPILFLETINPEKA